MNFFQSGNYQTVQIMYPFQCVIVHVKGFHINNSPNTMVNQSIEAEAPALNFVHITDHSTLCKGAWLAKGKVGLF